MDIERPLETLIFKKPAPQAPVDVFYVYDKPMNKDDPDHLRWFFSRSVSFEERKILAEFGRGPYLGKTSDPFLDNPPKKALRPISQKCNMGPRPFFER